jgi:hypothetical protein
MAYTLIHGRKGTDGEHGQGSCIDLLNILLDFLDRWYQWLASAKLQWHDLFICWGTKASLTSSTHPFTWFFRLSDSQLPGEIHHHDVESRWSLMNSIKRKFWSDDQNIAICHWLILFIFYDNKASKHCDHSEGAVTSQVVGHYLNSYSTHSILLIIYNILYFSKYFHLWKQNSINSMGLKLEGPSLRKSLTLLNF